MKYQSLISLAELSPDTPTLDLHGMRIHEAEIEIDRFLDKHFRLGTSVVRIIHGKGTERLAKSIPDFTSSHPLVLFVGGPGGTHETGAVIYAVLHG